MHINQRSPGNCNDSTSVGFFPMAMGQFFDSFPWLPPGPGGPTILLFF